MLFLSHSLLRGNERRYTFKIICRLLLLLREGLLVISQDCLIAYGCTRASGVLHASLIKNVLRCAVAFFESTPLGRIINRFSKDLDVIDRPLPVSIDHWIYCALEVLATAVVLSISSPWITIAFPPLAVIYYVVQVTRARCPLCPGRMVAWPYGQATIRWTC